MRFQANRDPSQVRVQGDDTLVITADARESKHSDGKTGVSLAGVIRAVAEGGTGDSARRCRRRVQCRRGDAS